MESRLIFLDIDGTFTTPGSNEPPESAVRAVKEAQKKGHKVFICTGRNYEMLSPLLKFNFDGVIGSSGGYVECEGKVIYDRPMTEEETKKAIDSFDKNGVYYTIECVDGAYTHEGFKEFLKEHANEKSNSELLRWREQIESNLNILPMSEYKGQPVYKVIVMTDSSKKIEEPVKELTTGYHFVVQEKDRFGFINGELTSDEYDKGKAIKRVCEYYGMSLSDTVGIGDSMNDYEMLEIVGLSICMENGADTLKGMVDDICPAVGSDGIYRAFYRHGLV